MEASAPAGPKSPLPRVVVGSVTYHPAVFSSMIKQVDPAARDGGPVAVYNREGLYIGTGLWNKDARIGVRVYSIDESETLDDAFFQARLDEAVSLRREFLQLDARTDAYRVVHGEGDRLSGLTLDRLGDTLVGEVFSRALWGRLPGWLPGLHARLGTLHHRITMPADVARKEKVRKAQPLVSKGLPETLRVTENGVRYWVDLREGHKTGFFCDQRENRRRLAAFCAGQRVLDLCCYTGGFALSAKVTGKAGDVTGVDLDEKAVALARRNGHLNQCRVNWVHADAYSYARQMVQNGERFDVVVCDPPKFWLTRAGEQGALSRYNDLNALAGQLLRPGGLLVTCSCSGLLSPEHFQATVTRAIHRLGKRLQILDFTGAGPDHPVWSSAPETRYLKVLWARVW